MQTDVVWSNNSIRIEARFLFVIRNSPIIPYTDRNSECCERSRYLYLSCIFLLAIAHLFLHPCDELPVGRLVIEFSRFFNVWSSCATQEIDHVTVLRFFFRRSSLLPPPLANNKTSRNSLFVVPTTSIKNT